LLIQRRRGSPHAALIGLRRPIDTKSLTTFAVLTPSYAPDFELCSDLNRSVLQWTAPDVQHHIIVPSRDRDLFASLHNSRTTLWTVDELLPRRMLPVPALRYTGSQVWLNLRRPYPPVRGWVMQQVVKLKAAAESGADIVLLADSDVLFIRPVSVERLFENGRLRFYRSPGTVDQGLPRHRIWHEVASRLLGLAPPGPPPLPDYVSALNVWDRTVVAQLRDRLEQVNHRPWLDTIAAQRHVSEFILYGVFVDRVLGKAAPVFPSDSMLCHSYWRSIPLTPQSAEQFLDALPPDDVAVMISAKSRTPLALRRAALHELAQRIRASGQ
jgi:hypothetical protein